MFLYRDEYYRGSLTDNECELLLQIVQAKSVGVLKNIIKNTPDHVVMMMQKDLTQFKKEGNSSVLNGYEISEQGTLTDAQTVGVAFLYHAKSALLGDEVGLGKTVQVAGLLNLLKEEKKVREEEFSFCFLTEKSNVPQIQEKLIKFTGDYVYRLDSAERKEVEKYFSLKKLYNVGVVAPHSLLNSGVFMKEMLNRPFDIIIVDESSVLKNNQSEIYKNTKEIFNFVDRKVLLNATPVETNLRDIYNQLALLDKGYLPKVTDFNKQFVKFKKTFYGFQPSGYKNVEFFKKAISLRYLARTRKDLGADYENNTYKMIVVPLSEQQKELMRKSSLKQMINDYPSGVDRNIPFNIQTTPKLDALYYLLENEIDVNSQVLIYCRFIEAQEALKEHLESMGFRVGLLNGRSSLSERDKVVKDFNEGNFEILITNVLRGLDLRYCDNCILYTIDPNPQKMVQFEGRITRDLDIKYKNVYMLVSMGREKDFVENELKLRVKMSKEVVNQGNSMVIQSILEGDNKIYFERVQQDGSSST